MWDNAKKTIPVLALALLGLGISIAIEIVHRRLTMDVNYASFCNVNSSINCDVVLSSRYSQLGGFSVSMLAILYYVAVSAMALGIASMRLARRRALLATLIFVAAVWGLVFSGYMAAIAAGVLHTMCLMCGALYLVSICLFAAAWRLRSRVSLEGRRQTAARAARERSIVIGSIVLTVASVVVASWEVFGRAGRPLSAAEIERQHPDFYRWFFAQPTVQVPRDAAHWRGTEAAPITIVEFSDFECTHCAAFHQSLDDVLRLGDHNVRVVFRHFPLDSACNAKVPSPFHPQACLAAVASECAAEQGKFWEYHNLLFDNQQHLEREFLIGYATRLGFDVGRFTNCLGSDQARARVEQDAQAGAALGVQSTPTLFINGRTIKGALERDQLLEALTLARPDQ